MTIKRISSSTLHAASLPTGAIVRKGYSPYINEETGSWMVYDDELQQYVDSGVQATGSTSQSQIANIIQSMVVDYAQSGNMSPITSNAVNVLVGNVEALMGSI